MRCCQASNRALEPTYRVHPISPVGVEPLRCERRLLTQWFKRQFGPQAHTRLAC